MVIGETNDANGFSVVFSEPVKAQVLGWQGVLIPNESRPDPTLIYNSFNFAALEIQPGLEVVNITFGIRKVMMKKVCIKQFITLFQKRGV